MCNSIGFSLLNLHEPVYLKLFHSLLALKNNTPPTPPPQDKPRSADLALKTIFSADFCTCLGSFARFED